MKKILIGGSPCTHWSIAQKNNRETIAEGIGWELFKNYLIAKEKFRPDYFLYENNKSAAQPIKDQISTELKVQLQYINSALVSAQNRQRFYAHNILNVPQPEDRGILLKDILETNPKEICYSLVEPSAIRCRGRKDKNGEGYAKYEARCDGKSNTLDTNTVNGSMVAEPIRIGTIENPKGVKIHDSQAQRVYSFEGKSVCLQAGSGGQGAKTGLYAVPIGYRGRMEDGKWIKRYEAKDDGKANALTTAQTDSMVAEQIIYELDDYYFKGGFGDEQNPNLIGKIICDNTSDNNGQPAQGTRIYSPNGKMICIDADSRKYIIDRSDGTQFPCYEVKNGLIIVKGKQYPIKLPDGYYIIRKLTPIECERLQTLPDNYTRGVSDTQRYKGIGNGWTAEVIIHILKYMNIPLDEEIQVLSMFDGIGTGRYCFDKIGYKNVHYVSYEIDRYAMQIANNNYPKIIQCGDAFQIRSEDWQYKN